MFKLDHLEISGFKSFVDPVSVKFTGSLNAIVGPNGCGKSNVSDAVTWVLGERSAKSLRATRMEDVIFNGSQSRKPLGMAEVNLTLQTDPTLPEADDGKLTIGRRLFRSGESHYLINGKKARLKEIKDLLMGTGLGLRAYSVIEQGKIDAILSGKPQERRRLLEEAAGITKYKERKRIAEVKLEEAAANLARIDDIVSEVERSLRSLKRQANSARRYGDRKAQYDALLQKLLLRRWHEVKTQLDGLAGEMGTHSETEAAISAKLHRADAELTSSRESVDKLADTYSDLRQREAEIVATIEGKQEFVKGSKQLLEEIAERLESGEALAVHRRDEIERLDTSRTSYEEIHASTSQATDTAAAAVEQTNAQMEEAQGALRGAEDKQEDLRSRLLASLGEVNALNNQLHRLQVESEKGSYRATHIGEELAQRKAAYAKAHEAAAESRRVVDTVRAEAGGREDVVEKLSNKLAKVTGKLAAIEEETTAKSHALSVGEHRHALLEELSEAQHEKRSKMEELLRANGQEDIRFLTDGLEVPADWEHSIDLYLAEMADAVVLPAESDPLEVGRSLLDGRGTHRLLLPRQGAKPRAIEDDAIESSLAEALGLSPELANAMPEAFLVARPKDAVRLAREYPGVAFLSRDRVWAQSGVVHLQGREAEAGALTRDKELERLATEIADLKKDLAALAVEKEQREAKSLTLGQELESETATLEDTRRRLAVAEARRDDLEAADRRLALESDTLVSEREEVNRELERIRASLGETETKLSASQDRHSELEELFDTAQKTVGEAREQREDARTSGASRRGQLELLKERLDSHQRGLERIDTEIISHKDHLERWAEQKASLEARRATVQERIVEAEKELQAALEARSGSEAEVRRQEEILRDARGTQLGLEESVRNERSELESVRAALGELRVSEASLKQDAEHLQNDYREHFETGIPDLYEVPEEAVDELEVDTERMKNLLHRMGPINELAAEEFEEQETRHEYLTTQRADVISSVERLRETIREINETSSERFRETFEAVNEALGVTFHELFNGGEAEMRLMDEEDLLESGIEIVARPPGKRLQNIMLLSGGEKALTALALLFALFRTKPSPFCILDEVDAPLDDVNTLRFVGLLKKMAVDTQFVVISHNKLTMSAASALYGVTMEERGVSRVVSVELDEIHPEEQAASA